VERRSFDCGGVDIGSRFIAPWPMKMGTIASPWRYGAAASSALQLAILRYFAIEHDASWIPRYVG
jgi:hypothetical protein